MTSRSRSLRKKRKRTTERPIVSGDMVKLILFQQLSSWTDNLMPANSLPPLFVPEISSVSPMNGYLEQE